MGDNRYCLNCNYATSKTEIEQMRIDIYCPSCGFVKMSNFYSVGSDTHRSQVERFKNNVAQAKRGVNVIVRYPPPALKRKDDHG